MTDFAVYDEKKLEVFLREYAEKHDVTYEQAKRWFRKEFDEPAEKILRGDECV
jgi:hypothetical protein